MMHDPYIAGVLSPDSVMEMACGIGAIMRPHGVDIPTYIEAVGGGTLLARYNDTPDVLEPGYFIWRQGNMYYVHILGTDVAASDGVDLYLDVLGYLYSDFPIGEGNRVHTYFSQAARAIALSTQAAIGIPVPPNFQGVYLSGHSYGGACALLAGYYLRNIFPDKLIYVMTFGAPKAFFGRPNIPSPDRIVHVINESDPVPYVPFDTLVSLLTTVVFQSGTVPILENTVWQNPGIFYLLRDNVLAQIPGNTWQTAIPPRRIVISQHYMARYLAQLADWDDTQ
jgi:hypothetical protein